MTSSSILDSTSGKGRERNQSIKACRHIPLSTCLPRFIMFPLTNHRQAEKAGKTVLRSSVKCVFCKPKSLGWDAQHPLRSQVQRHVSNSRALEAGTASLALTSQAA